VGVLAAFVLALAAGGCRQLNESHCGNQQGDLTCEQRDPSAPICDRCQATNDGCIAGEPMCGEGSSGLVPITATTTAGESSTAATDSASTAATEVVDSSTGEPNLCGNRVLDDEEACDGDLFPPETPDCEAMMLGTGMYVCTENCTVISYMSCKGYMEECGNGEVGEEEECDGTNFANMTCGNFPNLTGDGLVCSDDCMFDTTGCTSCREHGQSCGEGDACCNAPDDTCAALSKKCCAANLGLCTD